jgi:PBSX family phage terminase large subunit
VQLRPLTGKQRESVRLCQSRLNIWEGSVRSSKTISSLFAWLRFVRRGPAGNLLMCGKTERTLKRNIIDPLTEMLGPSRCRLVGGSGELWLLNRRVYLAGANDERSQEKIRGLSLVGAYCDEISTIPESFWSMLLSRLSAENAALYGSSNPDSPAHWLKRDFLDRAAVHLDHDGAVIRREGGEFLDLARFSFRLADNPHLPAAYVASLDQEYVGLWHKRYVEGLWVAAAGAIYDMFDPDRHVVSICPVIKRWVCCSVDYGTRNPLHALLLGIGIDRRLYVVAEWRWDSRARHRQLTDAEYSVKLREWLASVRFPGSQLYGVTPERVVIDPSAASFRQQLHNDGFLVTEGVNAVLDGIRLVASLLGSGRLLISASCQHLIDEMSSYAWDDAARLRGEDKPLKINDHGADSLRYALATTRSVWRNEIRPTEAPPNYQDTFGVAL